MGAIAQSGRPHDAIRIFDHMRARGLASDAHACIAPLTMLARSWMTATARKVFDDMARAGAPSTRTLATTCCTCASRRGDAARSELLMTSMDTAGMPLDRFWFNTVIALYIRKGMQYEEMCVWERMGNEGDRGGHCHLDSVIHGMCKEGG
ncbi:hypothetical protein ACQ4PT_002938 [Festuca glaucescens]